MQMGDDHDGDAAYQAANWLILLSEEPVPEQTWAEFEAWLAASPDHARAWTLAEETYGLIGRVPRKHAPVETLATPRAARGRGRTAGGRRWPSRLALSGALAASLAMLAAPSVWLRIAADRTTGAGEVATMALADGSRIVLGPSTAVRVRYSGAARHVDLLAGEASFDVQRNPQRPFVVQAGPVTAMVLGTAFEVRRERTGTFVAVAHGKVRVREQEQPLHPVVDLRAGDWVRLGATVEQGQALASQEPPERRMVIAKDRPVSEVIDRLRPWFWGAIVVSGDGGRRMRVTGAYDPADPARALALLLSAHGGRVRVMGPWLIWVSLADG